MAAAHLARPDERPGPRPAPEPAQGGAGEAAGALALGRGDEIALTRGRHPLGE
jgi:hypothetical protein